MSYRVYTESFRRLPSRIPVHIRRELHKVLTAASIADDCAHLELNDHRAILEILKDTCPELTEGW